MELHTMLVFVQLILYVVLQIPNMFCLDPNNPNFLDTLDFLLKLVGGLGAFYLFIVGFNRYKKDQTWKKSEFVSKEIKEFESDSMVRNVMCMLDWGSRKIELFPNKPTYDDRFAKVNRQILKEALMFHESRIKEPDKDRFTEVEVAIRDNIDRFFSYFEKFEQFILAGLITKNEIEPYIIYWINTIAHDLEQETRERLYIFLDKYNYRGTQALFSRFEKNITPSKS